MTDMVDSTGKYRMLVGLAAMVAAVVLSAGVAVSDTSDQAMRYWPQWRGPLSTGVAPRGNPPVEWSETRNIRWKTPLPGSGHSTPIVWGDYIFVTTAIPYGEKKPPNTSVDGAHGNLPVTQASKFVVLAVNRRDGKILWQKTMRAELPHEDAHYTGTMASNSAVTDGESVLAFFG